MMSPRSTTSARRTRRSEAGFAYVAILVLFMMMTGLGLSFVLRLSNDMAATAKRGSAMPAHYLAEAAVNHAMWRLLNEPSFPSDETVYYMHSLGAGRYGYKVRRHTDTTYATVAAIGAVDDRVISQSYVLLIPPAVEEECVALGLAGHWTLDDLNGGLATDSAGGAHASMQNMEGDEAGPGQVGTAAVTFDGVDEHLRTGEGVQILSSTDYTASIWIRPDATQKQWAGIYAMTNTSGSQNYFNLQFNNQSQRRLVSYNGGSSWDTGLVLADVADAWHHVAIVREGNLMSSYLDGVLVRAQTFSSNPTLSPGHLNIGADRTGSSSYVYAGAIDDLRFYDRPLALDEIQTLAQNNCSPCLSAHYELEERTGTTAVDSSEEENDSLLMGSGFTFDSSSTGAGLWGRALVFDGANDTVQEASAGNYLNGLDAITIALWVKSDVTGQDRGIYFSKNPTSGDSDLGLRYDQSGYYGGGTSVIKAAIRTTDGATQVETTSNVHTTDWQHLAVVWTSGSSLQVYIDGVLDPLSYDQGPVTGTVDGVEKMMLGLGTKNRHWDGSMDDIRVYCRALSATEIAELATPPESRKVYWAEANADLIQRAGIDGSNTQDIVETILTEPYDVAVDLLGEKLYWIDAAGGAIRRSNLDGSSIEDLVTSGLLDPAALAIDVTGGKMYWVDAGLNHIQRANLDGSNIEDVVTSGLSEPRGIAIDPGEEKIYWTDEFTDTIRRASLDGTNVEDLITTGLNRPQGIALDLAGGKMYWADAGLGRIQRADLDGSSVEDIASGLSAPVGIAIDPGAAGGGEPGIRAYWYESIGTVSNLSSIDWSTEDVTTIESVINYPSTSGALRPGGPNDRFAVRFSGTIAIPSTGTWTFYTNSDDGSDLSINGTPVVNNDGLHGMRERSGSISLTAGVHDIEVRMFERTGRAGIIASWAGPGVSKEVIPASAYSQGGGGPGGGAARLYWSDSMTGSIWGADLDGANAVELLTGLPEPRGIDVDSSNVPASAISSVDGLLAHWKLDETGGASAAEEIAGANGVLQNMDTSADWVEGYIGGGLDMDGVDDYVDLSAFSIATDTITLTAWINGWKASNWAGIVYSRTSQPAGMDFGNNDTLHYTWNNNSSSTYGWNGGPRVPQDEWAFVAIAVDPSRTTAYVWDAVNGLQSGSNNIAHVTQLLNQLRLGHDNCCGSRYFRGVIDDVRIYDHALSPTEIALLVDEANNSASNPGLTAYWYDDVGNQSSLSGIDWSTEDTTTVEPDVNFSSTNGALRPGGPTQRFAVRFAGKIDVPADGNWTFYTRSDDGSDLSVNGIQVVNNDGLHGMRERSGTIALTAGQHDIEIRMFERGGRAGIIASWAGPGVSKEVIPTGAFFH